MTVKVNDLKTPIGDILQAVGHEGGVLQPPGQARYALLALDDDVLDFLLERSPKFIEECQEIRKQMQEGRFHTHSEVKCMFAET